MREEMWDNVQTFHTNRERKTADISPAETRSPTRNTRTQTNKQTQTHGQDQFFGFVVAHLCCPCFYNPLPPKKRIAVKFAMHIIQTQQTNWIECDSSVLNRIHFNLGTLCRTSTFKHDDSFFFSVQVLKKWIIQLRKQKLKRKKQKMQTKRTKEFEKIWNRKNVGKICCALNQMQSEQRYTKSGN